MIQTSVVLNALRRVLFGIENNRLTEGDIANARQLLEEVEQRVTYVTLKVTLQVDAVGSDSPTKDHVLEMAKKAIENAVHRTSDQNVEVSVIDVEMV